MQSHGDDCTNPAPAWASAEDLLMCDASNRPCSAAGVSVALVAQTGPDSSKAHQLHAALEVM